MIYQIYTGGEDVYPYKLTVIIILVLKYFFEQYINYRQLKVHMIKRMPPSVAKFGITQEQFQRSQNYCFDKLAFEMYVLSLKVALDTVFLLGNILPLIWQTVRDLWFIDSDSEFQRAFCYVIVQGLKMKTFDVPIDFYRTFVIENKYNSSETKTFYTFWHKEFVQTGLMIIIIPPILYGYLLVVDYSGQYFYLSVQIFVFVVTLLLDWIHPNLIAPLFSKIIQLRDPLLKQRISRLAAQINFPLQQIQILDNSMRSSHSNAHFYGIGKNKRIVLYETLIKSLNSDQIVSVIGHQLGHWKFNHSLYKFVFYIIQVFFLFYIFSFFRNNEQIYISFGFQEKSTFIGTAIFFYLFQPIRSIFEIVGLVMSRYFQFQADQFSCSLGYSKPLLTGLKKMFRQSATIIPDPAYSWCKHSHPSIHERIYRIKQFEPDLRSSSSSWSSHHSRSSGSVYSYYGSSSYSRNYSEQKFQ